MATWHQMRARRWLGPLTSWSIVDDPPDQCRTVTSGFASREDAEARLAVWRKNRPGEYDHAYVLGPQRDYAAEAATRRQS